MRPTILVVGRRAASVSGLRFSATVAAEAVCEAVFAAGGEPLVLHGADRSALPELPRRLAGFAGVVLPGGSDLDPDHYGQARGPETEPDHPEQDALDLAVARAVLALALPTLAICRGLQVVNAVCGGTLVQHLPPGPVEHLGTLHPVTAVPGSRLHTLLGAASFPVSSYHHQAVDRLGDGLVVSARSADGCVEAVEHTAADLLAVQWHPEDLAGSSRQDAALFGDLVDRAQAREAHGRKAQARESQTRKEVAI
ncbi:gamma-glutamyl-gamma-aminobutyrate hydrolase family protein [Peterkaempfera bronchialis]|uniref:Gamma-glutamyl-gamma-aminobutyrate hydrolase family protein n=1 Tax=Peterkaempfera bronchialis TaxID=2126346 RepID=A0A345T311_9ACTN|nr:gamma-glutamyl-gamma-aminobutyrate hydrolase family protein [Peterkaempfera bronchialis]AXI80366.1 gamma-glutamyl-gamma-aminobutyrate hydrolase family protein [Peterkaempfera bronchialis]